MVILTVVNHLKKLGDKGVALGFDMNLRRRCTKSKKGLVIGIVKSHGLV